MQNRFLFLFMPLAMAACTPQSAPDEAIISMALPEAHSNNAVALGISGDGPTLYSFNGLKSGKAWNDTSHAAFACTIAQSSCREIASVPVAEGRLASAAVTVAGKIYIFGGYSVAENGDEKSTPEVFAFDPGNETYIRAADMPVPVDDMVAAVYQDRYIYLISGWHDDGNVSHVQLYDTETGTWSRATDYPGAPVFGHAGGIAADSILVTDGVAVVGVKDGKRQFGAVNESWRGDIDPADPTNITWRKLPPHPGKPLYRMASMGDDQAARVIFAGGADNPYNYDGIGYDGVPAEASDAIFAYDFDTDNWETLGTLPAPGMDYRGLLHYRGHYYLVGGMDAARRVSGKIVKFRIDD